MKPYCSAIIPAAGNSTRMAMGQSKQFLPLLGKPAIVYTLQAFEQAKSVDEIILVCRDEDKEQLNTCVHMAGITKPVIFYAGRYQQTTVCFQWCPCLCFSNVIYHHTRRCKTADYLGFD